jgi:Cu+-exporting ATPase
MQVEIANAAATYVYQGKSYYFCMPGCMESFAAEPEKYLASIK